MSEYTNGIVLMGLDGLAKESERDLAPILAKYKLSMSFFRNLEQDLPYATVEGILEDCATAWNMPDVGVRLASRQTLESMGVVSLVTRMETTVRSATQAVERNMYLLTNVLVTAIREIPGTDMVELIYSNRGEPFPRQVQEWVMTGDIVLIHELCGQKPKVVSAEVMHAAPTGPDVLSKALGCRVRYGASRSALMVHSSIMDVRLEKQDRAFHPIIRRYLAEVSVEQGLPFSERVNLEVYRLMSLGGCSQDKVAAALNMQTRSLQRRLKAEGTSFREIVDKQRRRKAKALVEKSNLSLGEVALAVGYSDQTAFNQAFRRWFDQTPLQMRKPDVSDRH